MRGISVLVRSSIAAAVLAVTFGCNGSTLAPTSPTAPPPATPIPPPPAAPDKFVLSGRVTETPPTVNTGIGRALVRIVDGPDAGKSATTNSMGYYSILDVTPGSAISVSADGYVEMSHPGGNGRDQSSFQLMPVPATRSSKMSDTLDASVGTCSDGVSAKPCHIMTIPVHNSGPLEATLSWEPAQSANLDLSLFRGDLPQPVYRAATDQAVEQISLEMRGGANIELRVTYRSGTAPVKYSLRVTHQN
jgi:hypothetical protein